MIINYDANIVQGYHGNLRVNRWSRNLQSKSVCKKGHAKTKYLISFKELALGRRTSNDYLDDTTTIMGANVIKKF